MIDKFDIIKALDKFGKEMINFSSIALQDIKFNELRNKIINFIEYDECCFKEYQEMMQTKLKTIINFLEDDKDCNFIIEYIKESIFK